MRLFEELAVGPVYTERPARVDLIELDDPARQASLGAAARAMVVGDLSWEACAGRYRELYEELAEMTRAFEERYLRKALRRTRGHVGKCAKLTGLSRRSVTDKIGQYKIDKEQFKGG